MAQWNLAGMYVYFITVTYPGVYGDNWEMWKRDIDVFRKWLERTYPSFIGACWREEFQKRGAPHFHLIAVFDKRQSKEKLRRKVARRWADIVKDGYGMIGGDLKEYKPHYRNHLKAGTQVLVVNSRRQLMKYVSKYVAKSEVHVNVPDAWGRSWGFWNCNGVLNFDPVEEVELGHEEAVVLKRLVRKWMKARGKTKLSRRLSMQTSYSALGLGAESENGDLAYKMIKAAKSGLFEPHISPWGFHGRELTFMERVKLGFYEIRKGLTVGCKVKTPHGYGVVSRIVECSVLHRLRVTVNLECRRADGSRFGAYDLWDVSIVERVCASQPVLF
jgi:hypothetical protein